MKNDQAIIKEVSQMKMIQNTKSSYQIESNNQLPNRESNQAVRIEQVKVSRIEILEVN